MTRERCSLALLAALAAAISAAGCGSSDPESARVESYRCDRNVEGLARETASDKAGTAQAAVRALGTLGLEAIPRLQESLKDSRPEVRIQAALAYGQAIAAAGPAVPAGQIHPLAVAVRTDTSPGVRAAAVTALGRARAMDEMQTLLAALEDPDGMVRARANAAVARITGRRYETYVNGTPEQRHAAVAQIRQQWAADERGTRDYYRSQQAKGKPKAGK